MWKSVEVFDKKLEHHGRGSTNQKQSLIVAAFRALYIFCKYMLQQIKNGIHISSVTEA